ncbi:MAG TPA: hypothetical protein VGI39_17620 [Polyangiaceae bacterium]|jgi:hypothetical protein
MRKLALSASALVSIFPVLVTACAAEVNTAPPATTAPPPAPTTTVVVDGSSAPPPPVAQPVTPPPAPAPAPVASTPDPAPAPAAGDFYTCAADTDCVSVPKVGCCHNGHHEAVNKQSVDAYKNSFTCEKKHPMCPQYIVKETRVAKCDTTAHKCVMAAP